MDVDVGEGPADALGPDAQPVDVVDGERGGQRQDQRLIGVLPETQRYLPRFIWVAKTSTLDQSDNRS